MNLLTSRNLALLFGVVFVAVGIIGFVPNPIASETGIFQVNGTHNLIHVLTGAFLLSAVLVLKGKENLFLMIAGVVYLAVAVLGFVDMSPMMMGHIMMNEADRYLHVLLAAALLGGAYLTKGK